MAAIAIRLELQQYRPLAGAHPFKRRFCRTAYSENVHSVHLNTRNTKAFAPPVKLVLGGGAIDRSAHGVLIILNHEDDRQLPKLGHVEAFVDLPLVGRAISKICDADAAIILVFLNSETRRVGKECVSTCRSRWSPYQ